MANVDIPTADPLTAGRFAALTLLTPKALRIYADKGLLPPDRVDPVNGYRYYTHDQVATGWLIALLRSADMPLDQVATVIRSDPEGALAAIDSYEAGLERRAAANRFVLDRARHHFGKD